MHKQTVFIRILGSLRIIFFFSKKLKMASYRSNINCTVLSTESVSTVSCTSGTGDTGRHSTSVLQTGEIDKLVSQIKCKRTFQDDDSLNGQATAVYSSPAVSQLFGLICGPDKQDLKPDTRESLKDLEQFYKDLIKGTCVSNGSSVKEGLNELFHNPEHIVFQDLLVKEPVDWSKELILPLLESIQRKEALKEELQKNVRETQKKRRELAKEIGLERKRLGEIKVMRKDKVDKMHPDNIRRLTIGLEADNAEVAKLEVK